MPRNRLEELQTLSKHAPVTEEEEMKPLNDVQKNKNKKNKPPDPAGAGDDFQQFLTRMEEVVGWVDVVEKNTLELRSLQRKLLAATHKDEASERRVDDLNEENKTLAKKIRTVLKAEQEWGEKRTAEMASTSPKKRTPQAQRELQMRKTQNGAQARRFYDVWAVYNGDQVDFHEKTKKLFVKRCKITGVSLTEEEIEEKIKERDTAMFARGILDQERVAKQQLTELENRHEEFIKLEKSIQEVRDMFVEVAQLVEGQGEMIDRIENTVIAAQGDVEKGKDNLQEAEKKKKQTRKLKVCLYSTLAVVIIIVLLVVLSEFGAFSGGGGGGGGEQTIVVVHEPATETGEAAGATTTTTPAPKTVAP